MDGPNSRTQGSGHPARGGTEWRAPPVDRLGTLLQEVCQGDEVAFAELYDATSARLFGLIRRVVGDQARSEEVACQAFLEIWRTAAHFDAARGSAMGWMLAIAHRTAVQRVRSVDAHGARRVEQAKATLSFDRPGALDLAYFGGYTHTEVGTILGLPVGTAQATLRDSLGDLRRTPESHP